MAKGDLEGTPRVLHEAGRNLPDGLRGQLNELNMGMATLHSRRPRDPYSGMSEEKRPYVGRHSRIRNALAWPCGRWRQGRGSAGSPGALGDDARQSVSSEEDADDRSGCEVHAGLNGRFDVARQDG